MGRQIRHSADQSVIKAGEIDKTLLTPGRTRAQRLREAQPQSATVANSQSTLMTKSPEDLTSFDIKTILNQNKVPFKSKAKKAELLDVLNRHKQHGASEQKPVQLSEPSLTENTQTEQVDPSGTPSTPQLARAVEEQVEQQVETSIKHNKPGPSDRHLKRKATQESLENVAREKSEHKAKKLKIKHDGPDRKTHPLQGRPEQAGARRRQLKWSGTNGSNNQAKRMNINNDSQDDAPLKSEGTSNQSYPTKHPLKRKAANEKGVDAYEVGHQAKKRKTNRENPNTQSTERRTTNVQQQDSQNESNKQHNGSTTDSEDGSETILEQERNRRKRYSLDGDGDVAMGGLIQQVAREEIEQEGVTGVNPATRRELDGDGNGKKEVDRAKQDNGKAKEDKISNTETIETNIHNHGLLRQNKAAASTEKDSQHRTANRSNNSKKDGTNVNIVAKGQKYDENARVCLRNFYTKRDGYLRIIVQDPETFKYTEARVEGKTRVKGYTVISFPPIPLETGRPRRYYAVPNKSIHIDPKTIPNLQTGTQDELQRLEDGVVPEGACYKFSGHVSSRTFRLAGFREDFGGTKDPSRTTWFSFSVCISRFQGHTYAIFNQTWDQAGQTRPDQYNPTRGKGLG